jgi:hypothetical protein
MLTLIPSIYLKCQTLWSTSPFFSYSLTFGKYLSTLWDWLSYIPHITKILNYLTFQGSPISLNNMISSSIHVAVNCGKASFLRFCVYVIVCVCVSHFSYLLFHYWAHRLFLYLHLSEKYWNEYQSEVLFDRDFSSFFIEE